MTSIPNLNPPELIDCTNVEQIIACAELLMESRNLHPEIRPEKVAQVKAIIRQLAQQMNTTCMALAIYWLAFRDDLGQYARSRRQSDASPAVGNTSSGA